MTGNNLVAGWHPNTATLRNVLAAKGITAPHNGKPFTEAMLLGIAGGLGAGYILWEFSWSESAIIVMGFSNRWNYAAEYMTTLSERLNLSPQVQETGGVKAAAANLDAALAANDPAIVWVDQAHLPHQGLPESLQGYGSRIVGVYGREGDELLVDDLGEHLYRVPADKFAAGRARIGSDKNRLLRVTAPKSLDLSNAIMTGLQAHLEHLGRDSESFSLPVYKKWAKLMTDTKNKKGWPVVFKKRTGLYGTLRSVFEGITLNGTEGAGLRAMYADFLDEAAPVLNKPALKDAAKSYRAAADQWRAFAHAALSADVFAETRDLMQQRYALTRANDMVALHPVMDRLEGLLQNFNHDFPLDDTAVTAIFTDLQNHLEAVYTAEVDALAVLTEAVN